MADRQFNEEWVDRYVRDELSAEDEAAFEEALLEDAELQAQVEAVLGIRETLKREQSLAETASLSEPPVRNQWSTLAMAASVLLAVVSTTLFWRASVETNELREQVEALQQPRGSVLRVPVDIMRSAGNATPDVIVQKPSGRALLVLDIELSPTFRDLSVIQLELQSQGGEALLAWSASPRADGRVVTALNSEIVPDGEVWLLLSAPEGTLSESRLIEFRAPAD
jgi:hypothetical protein